MQARTAYIALAAGVAAVASPIAFLGTGEWLPYIICLSVLAVATAAAIGYAEMVNRRRLERDR